MSLLNIGDKRKFMNKISLGVQYNKKKNVWHAGFHQCTMRLHYVYLTSCESRLLVPDGERDMPVVIGTDHFDTVRI